MSGNEITALVETLERQTLQIQNLQTALWVLIGIMGVCTLLVVLFIIPLLLQSKRTLAEAEKTTKTVNTEIMPRINTILYEAEPVVSKVITLLGTVVSSMASIVEGFRFVGSMFGKRRKNKKEA
ncbi:MAG: hypothetical protein KAH30_04990 [Caldisericia bacterium]|nr:hypothetical protein [Caldisericia bacterium]